MYFVHKRLNHAGEAFGPSALNAMHTLTNDATPNTFIQQTQTIKDSKTCCEEICINEDQAEFISLGNQDNSQDQQQCVCKKGSALKDINRHPMDWAECPFTSESDHVMDEQFLSDQKPWAKMCCNEICLANNFTPKGFTVGSGSRRVNLCVCLGEDRTYQKPRFSWSSCKSTRSIFTRHITKDQRTKGMCCENICGQQGLQFVFYTESDSDQLMCNCLHNNPTIFSSNLDFVPFPKLQNQLENRCLVLKCKRF